MGIDCFGEAESALDLPCDHFLIVLIESGVFERAAQSLVDIILGLSCGRYEFSRGSSSFEAEKGTFPVTLVLELDP